MDNERIVAPDSTAVRVALWRAMHVDIDPPPHVLEDTIGLQLADPPDDEGCHCGDIASGCNYVRQ